MTFIFKAIDVQLKDLNEHLSVMHEARILLDAQTMELDQKMHSYFEKRTLLLMQRSECYKMQ